MDGEGIRKLSREIKFRVWDKYCKRMHICGENTHDSMWFDENNLAQYCNLQNGEGSSNDNDGAYELMQYTGLNDKNGKEIYEGDIIEFNPFMKYEIGVVDFSEGGFTANEWFLQSALTNGNEFDGKVIGNIYNNPELLNHE